MGLSTIHLVGVDTIEIGNSILIIETYLCMISKLINGGLFAVETLGSSFTWFRHEKYIYTNSIINDNDGNFKAQNVTYQMTYPVKTVYNLFHGVNICS